jgi:hypothetical protein
MSIQPSLTINAYYIDNIKLINSHGNRALAMLFAMPLLVPNPGGADDFVDLGVAGLPA